MRLTITPDELEKGSSIQRGTQEKITELEHSSRKKDLIAIHPTTHNSKRIGVIKLTSEGLPQGGRGRILQIFFRPVWCKCFRLCSMKADQLLALIIEVDDGKKYWVDDHSISECKFTTEGPGTDPKVVWDAETFLGDLIVSDPFNNVVRGAVGFVQRRF